MIVTHGLSGLSGMSGLVGGGGAAPFTPAQLSNLRQYALDGGNAYESSSLGGFSVLRSLEPYGTHREPRKGRAWLFDGTDDKLVSASVTGTTIVTKSGTASLTVGVGEITATAGTLYYLELSNGSIYHCNEESGTTGYDISGNGNHLTLTNITQSTFHATDTGVAINRNNSEGYRLSGSVYIPKRLSDANAADGNALTVTGQSPYPINVEVPCITGNGTSVEVVLSALFPVSADFDCTFNLYFVGSGTQTGILTQGVSGVQLYAPGGVNALAFWNGSASTLNVAITGSAWSAVRLQRTGGNFVLTIDGVSQSVTSAVIPAGSLYVLSGNATQYSTSRISDLRVTTGGVTTYFPLQDGPGSSNTNRDLSYIKSDGTYGVVAGAIVNGTVADIWANRCPVAEDWCSNYGGDIAANGAFLPGQISGSLAADGTAKTLTAGKFGNPYSRINFNPFTAAELNGLGLETAYAVTTARQSVSPTDTKFRRTKAAGDDRFFATAAALTGANKTNAEAYVS